MYTRLSTYYNYKAELLATGGGGVIADFSKNGSHLIVIEHVCRINKWRPGFILPRIAKVNLVTLQSSYPSWVLDDT